MLLTTVCALLSNFKPCIIRAVAARRQELVQEMKRAAAAAARQGPQRNAALPAAGRSPASRIPQQRPSGAAAALRSATPQQPCAAPRRSVRQAPRLHRAAPRRSVRQAPRLHRAAPRRSVPQAPRLHRAAPRHRWRPRHRERHLSAVNRQPMAPQPGPPRRRINSSSHRPHRQPSAPAKAARPVSHLPQALR